jgi:hypothetical protein
MKWISWLIFALFGFYLVGNNFSAKLGLIDDHEIAMFLGSDGQVKISEFIPTVMSTEVGKWGTYLRYRPSYYTLRVLETMLWRDNAMLWYLSRYVMLVVAMWLGWKIMSRYFPKILSYVFIFYLMTIPFWTDLLTRLGPSEIYGIVAIPLFIYGLLEKKLWMITVGYMVAVGAKENFLVLFPILLLYTGYRAYTKAISQKDIIATVGMTVYTLFIVGAIQTATAQAGADIYGASISYSDRLVRLYSYKRYIVESRHLQAAILIFGVGLIKLVSDVYKKGKAILHKNLILNHLIAGSLVGTSILSQYIFYDSKIPSNIRYDYPVMLLFPVLQMIAVSLLIQMLPPKIKGLKISWLLNLIVVAAMLLFIFKRGYGPVQQEALRSARVTQGFQQKLKLIEEKLKDEPQVKLVFVSEKYLDFEPIVSVSRYLTSRRINNEFMLYYQMEEDKNDPMELDDRLKAVMNGEVGDDGIFDRFTEYKIDDKPCYSITYGLAASHPTCPEIVKF